MGQSEATNRNQHTGQPSGTFANLGTIDLYYEIHGSGEPLILLHGGITASDQFGENIAKLAQNRQVIAVHMQGHGHTPDIDRPLRYEYMADDVAQFIGHLGLEKVDVMGYSMGGGVALLVAITYPQLVRKLVVVSMAMKRDGWYPEVIESLDQMGATAAEVGAQLKHSPLADMYPNIDWVVAFTKMGDMESRPYDWSAGVATIGAPTLLVFADADSIRLSHIVEFYQRLGGGQRDAGYDGSLRSKAHLAIVPGATHYDIFATTRVSDLVTPFLDAPLP